MAENTSQAAGRQPETAPLAAEPQPLVEALLQVVELVHRPLTDPEREQVRASIVTSRQASAAMMAYPLTNADEPDPIFAAYRAE